MTTSEMRARLVTKFAQKIHFLLAAAQNQPYEEGDVCDECLAHARELAALATPSVGPPQGTCERANPLHPGDTLHARVDACVDWKAAVPIASSQEPCPYKLMHVAGFRCPNCGVIEPHEPAPIASSQEEICAIAPSVTNSAAQPVTGSTSGTGTKNADTWRTVICGLPIIRKLLNGEDVTLETFKVNLIPDDVLFNAKPKFIDRIVFSPQRIAAEAAAPVGEPGRTPRDIAVSVGLAVYARMVRKAHDNNQVVKDGFLGNNQSYYVTLEQLESAFVDLRDEVSK
jgi:hypothetical protein